MFCRLSGGAELFGAVGQPSATGRTSGMLWMAIATARAAPDLTLASVATKVAIPSGTLCKPMATAAMMPAHVGRGGRAGDAHACTCSPACTVQHR